MANEVEEIKQRLDLAEVIGGYLPLAKAGTGSLKARCPFHQEKTPSFYVSRDKQMWYCFGCGEGGDLFTFVMKMEGMEFREVLKILADKAGVKLPEWKPEERSEREQVLEALALAARFYAAALADAPQAAASREYLRSRGVSPAMTAAFNLGWAPDSWDALQLALKKRGVKANDLEKSGMVLRRERGSGWYDRFRNRLMFPIRDASGRTVGFSGRVLAPETKEAKYINTPQTLVYNKSAALYGLDLARQAMREKDQAIVVEGNLDVIACHQIEMKNVVAASGTALTGEQLRILARYTRNLAIAFDSDSAGQNAARRGIELAIAQGFTMRVITIPAGAGKDPDECIKKDERVWREAVASAAHYMDYLIAAETAGRDLTDPAIKKKIGNALLSEARKIPDAIEQTHWLQKFSALLAVPEAILQEQMGRLSKAGTGPGGAKKSGISGAKDELHPAPSRPRLLSESFLALLFVRPELVAAATAATPPEILTGDDLRELYKAGVASYTQTGHFSAPPAGGAAAPDLSGNIEHNLLSRMILKGERDYASLSATAAEEELRTLQDALRGLNRSARLEDLRRRMRAAEQIGDQSKVAELEASARELMSSI
ncbi:DNA primase [Patescibacteria group bacterium]|nr:MAG: DNA primase [Patescibacteria group bacterium]